MAEGWADLEGAGFICQPCRDGIHKDAAAAKKAGRLVCPGETLCDCQHRTGK